MRICEKPMLPALRPHTDEPRSLRPRDSKGQSLSRQSQLVGRGTPVPASSSNAGAADVKQHKPYNLRTVPDNVITNARSGVKGAAVTSLLVNTSRKNYHSPVVKYCRQRVLVGGHDNKDYSNRRGGD